MECEQANITSPKKRRSLRFQWVQAVDFTMAAQGSRAVFLPNPAISDLWQICSKVHFQVLRPKKNQEYWPTDMRRFVCDKSANGLAKNCTDAGSFIHCPEDSHVTITIPGPEVRRRPRRTSALSDKHQTFKPIHRVSITYESYIILHCMNVESSAFGAVFMTFGPLNTS